MKKVDFVLVTTFLASSAWFTSYSTLQPAHAQSQPGGGGSVGSPVLPQFDPEANIKPPEPPKSQTTQPPINPYQEQLRKREEERRKRDEERARQHEAERLRREKMTPEERERERKKTQEEFKKRSEERRAENLRGARQSLKDAEKTKTTQPNVYALKLLELASAEYSVDKANTQSPVLVQQAVDFFLSNSCRATDEDANSFFRYLESTVRMNLLSRDQIVPDIKKLIEASDKIENTRYNWCQSAMSVVEQLDSRYDRTPAYGKQAKIDVLEHWVSLCKRNPGPPRDIPLATISGSLVRAYEAAGDTSKAEAISKERTKLPSDRSGSTLSNQLDYALLALKNGKVSESAQTWRQAAVGANWQFPRGAGSRLMSLLRQYELNGYTQEKDKLIDALLEHPTTEIITGLDPILEKDVKNLIETTNFDKAASIASRRSKAGEQINKADPGSYWTLKLSDIYLSMGRTAESKVLFDKVLASMALQGISTDSTKAARAELLGRLGNTRAANQLKSSLPPALHQPIKLEWALWARTKMDLAGSFHLSVYNSDTESSSSPMIGRSIVGSLSPSIHPSEAPIYWPQHAIPERGRRNESKSMPPAVEPRNITALKDAKKDPRVRFVPPGDYFADSLMGVQVDPKATEPVRIFLRDGSQTGMAIATLRGGNEQGKPINLQIWYNGTRKIVLEHNCRVNAVIYAPNATVEMPHSNHFFRGAIVADTIITDGHTFFAYDVTLRDKFLR